MPGTWSSPRTTWVISISASSNALESRNIGMPVDRSSTKSSIVLFSNVTSPRTMSVNVVVPVIRHAEAQRGGVALGEAAVAAEPVVAGRTAALLRPGLHLLARAVAPVGLARAEQRERRLSVRFEVVGLEHDLAVPVEAEPAERGQDVLDQLGAGPLPVGVLDPEPHLAAGAARLQPVEQRGAGVAHVEVPRGRGREAEARARWSPSEGTGRPACVPGQSAPAGSSPISERQSRWWAAVISAGVLRRTSSETRSTIRRADP